MSKYTTGEIAKLCGVSVRTVQYYDSRNILMPSELSEGGRRLYTDEDVKRLKIICFLRDIGLSINSIGDLLSEEHPENVISVLLDEQEKLLREELEERRNKLEMLEGVRQKMKDIDTFSVESFGDIAYMLENKKQLRKIRIITFALGIPFMIAEWTSILLWIILGMWIPFVVVMASSLPLATVIAYYYYKQVAYICPECHTVFRPTFKQMFFAAHTPTLRKLTCTCCNHKGYCVEVYKKEEPIHG